MKKSVYDKLEDIPQIDRDEGNYTLVNGKYVLLLDGTHPVQLKNTELVTKESLRETEKQNAIAAAVQPKDTEINSLKTQLATAQANTGLPAGQVAVPAEKVQVLNNFESLGKYEEVKTKVEEYGTLKEKTEAADRKDLFSTIAKANNWNEDAFAKIAEREKLHEKIEVREEVPDAKKPDEKVNRYYVKGKNPSTQADTTTIISEFVKTDGEFSPFLSSLIPTTNNVNRKKLPETNVGGEVEETSAASSYISKTYRKEAKE